MVEEIPKVQKACVVKKRGKDFEVEVINDYPVEEPKEGEILVRLTSSGVCHSDLSIIMDDWGMPMAAKVAGHEGVGHIVKLGPGVDAEKFAIGTKCGVPLVSRPCNECYQCSLADGEVFCQTYGFNGTMRDGTWRQYIIVPASYFIPVPEVKDDTVLGPILCSGVTVYKAIKASKARPGQWIAFTGAGGGLGSTAVQYAKAMGLRVIGIDGGEEKGQLVRSLGAEAYVDFTKDNVTETILKLTGGRGVKAAIQLAPASKSYNEAINYLDYDGYLWCVGLMPISERLSIVPMQLIFKNAKIGGSLVGTRVDQLEALDFVGRGLVTPSVKLYPMDKIQDILNDMKDHKIVGRAVIKLD